MSILDICVYPDPILKKVCDDVMTFDNELITLLDEMYTTMQLAHGIGLAAPQVGISKQITVIDVSEEQNERLNLVNPKIIWSAGEVPSEEGCLSIPEYRDTIKRNAEVIVHAKDGYGKEIEIKADGLLAICLQHEIDHLNGILFIDHLSRLKRELFKRWFKKQSSEK